MEFKLKVEGMACAHCSKAVENALSRVSGVSSVRADLEQATAWIQGEGIDLARLTAALADAGFAAAPVP